MFVFSFCFYFIPWCNIRKQQQFFLQLRQFRDVSNTLVCLFERANETLKGFNMYVEICLTTSHTTVSNSKLMRFGYFFIIQSALHCFVFFQTICLRSLNQSAKQDKKHRRTPLFGFCDKKVSTSTLFFFLLFIVFSFLLSLNQIQLPNLVFVVRHNCYIVNFLRRA